MSSNFSILLLSALAFMMPATSAISADAARATTTASVDALAPDTSAAAETLVADTGTCADPTADLANFTERDLRAGKVVFGDDGTITTDAAQQCASYGRRCGPHGGGLACCGELRCATDGYSFYCRY